MDFAVRAMTPDDWESYRGIRLEMLEDTPMAYTETIATARERDEAAWRERLRGSSTSVRFAAILDDGRWVGSMGGYVGPHLGPVLVGVYVAPKFRGDVFGVTSALMDAVEDWARGLSPSIRLDVHESNARAIAAYAKRGYVETGHTLPYPLAPSQLELEMIKQLR